MLLLKLRIKTLSGLIYEILILWLINLGALLGILMNLNILLIKGGPMAAASRLVRLPSFLNSIRPPHCQFKVALSLGKNACMTI